MSVESGERRLLGTFGGVFTPTLLTILGVIMYLRLGWVMGNGGLLGGWLVMLVAIGITTATGLSLSSIATNTRLGAGGPYAIISRSLGVEVGGSVGVPLFLSQALAVAMYIFGFREGWLWIFPDHPPLLVDLLTFALVFGIASISAAFAFRIQYVIMGIIAVSLVLIVASPATLQGNGEVTLWGPWRGSPENGFSGASFWGVFAVFFPAATGIMAGANMSGDLADPRRSIPRGTLAAIAVSSVVYLGLGYWMARVGTPEELTENYTFLIDKSVWGPGVLAGLLGATLSSALSSLVGAPRILVALVKDRVVPDVGGIGTLHAGGEPRRAMVASGVLVLLALLLRDLNAIAPLLSMFFLITYCVINVVVLLESSLGLQSYRPSLSIPRVVPLLGAVGSLFAMFIVSPTVSLIAGGVVVALYAFILRRGLQGEGDSRSGMFGAIAEWAAARTTEIDAKNARSWKPNLLVPVENAAELRGDFHLLLDLSRPEGSVKLLGLATEASVADLTRRITNLGKDFRRKGVFTTWSVLDSTDFRTGLVAGLQALQSAFFRPNILFLTVGESAADDEEVTFLWRESRRLGVGVALLADHPQAGLGKRAAIHLWVAPELIGMEPDEALTRGNTHLALLLAMRLARSWKSRLVLICAVPTEADRDAARGFLEALFEATRMPAGAAHDVMVGSLEACMESAPQSDLDILALPANPDLAWVRHTVIVTRSACLLVGDSGMESAVA